MVAHLIRLQENDKQTLGRIYFFEGLNQVLKGVTLELPDRDNKKNISRIPAGTYTVKKRKSKRFGEHFHVLDVEGRSLILIHVGNYYRQTEGCILIGQGFADIDKDGYIDITTSRYTLDAALERTPKTFTLIITDAV